MVRPNQDNFHIVIGAGCKQLIAGKTNTLHFTSSIFSSILEGEDLFASIYTTTVVCDQRRLLCYILQLLCNLLATTK